MILKQNSAVYPTETNSYLILLAMSIFVVHTYMPVEIQYLNSYSIYVSVLCWSYFVLFFLSHVFSIFFSFILEAQLVGKHLVFLSIVNVQK